MPFTIPPIVTLIASLAGLAGTGVGIGETLANQPSSPKPPAATPTAPTGLNTQQAAQAKAAISGQDANIQERAPGVAPDYITQNAPIFAGYGNTPGIGGISQGATNTFTGNPIAQVLRTLSTGGGGGGAPSASAQSFTPAGLQPSAPGQDFIESGLSSLNRSLGIQV